jgi:sugar phosphate isomerase/epimerase
MMVDKHEQKMLFRPLQEVAVDRSTDALSRAAMTAYEKEKKMKLKNPLFIAPENIFPEQYGSHPEELRNMVLESRKKMENMLKNKGMDSGKAKQVAADHIKATFDVGHANIWKKYFKGDEKQFKKWMMDEVGKLKKDGVLGHVHLSDNFGYEDEHLTPGQGNTPIQDFVEKIGGDEFKGKMIVESGGQPEAEVYKGVTGSWRVLNSPIYKVDGASQSWSDIEGSYFGRTSSPHYLVGEGVVPSKDWTLWSETPLE